MTPLSSWTSFGGKLAVFEHDSEACGCPMRFAVYTPPQALGDRVPVLWYLSGLTCDWSNVMEKSGIQRLASKLGIMVVAPDTSPRGPGVADNDAYDLGQGAGFYLTATEQPWAKHYAMDRYLVTELPRLIADHFPADLAHQGIFGHSMGGHGALTLHLKHPGRYLSCSAFAPVVAPSVVPWGVKAFTAYLGEDRETWKEYDACELVRHRASDAHILIDQGEADVFLKEQLRPELFEAAAREAGQAVTVRRHPGYDHSYYFVATFMDDHLHHHSRVLTR